MPTIEILTRSTEPIARAFEGNLVLGRGTGVDLSLDDDTVSRRHAILNRVGDGYFVSDLGSGNGTWLNGRRVSKTVSLSDGDELRLGAVELRFLENGSNRPDSPSPIPLDAELPDDHQVLDSLDADDPLHLLVERQESDTLRLRLELIYDVVSATRSILEEETLLSLLLDKLFDALPQADRGFVLLLDADTDELLPRISRDRAGRSTEPAVSHTLLTDAVRNRRGVLTLDAMHDERFAAAETVQNMRLRSVLCAPMIDAGEVLGVLQLDSSAAGVAFDREDMALLLGVAGQAAGLANARMHRELLDQQLLRQDLDLASRIQQCFLPRGLPDIPNHRLALEYRPALRIGGDYYDFLELPAGRIGLVVGDVSGKGVSAALCMARLSSLARFLARGEETPQGILQKLNLCLLEEFAHEGMFATLLLLALDPLSAELTAVNAGHLAPLVRHRDGTVQELAVPLNPGLGIDPEAEYETLDSRLEPGDVILLHSDGVIEATAPGGEQFGAHRLTRVLEGTRGGPIEIVDAVSHAVKRFHRGISQADDLTVIACGKDP